MGRLTGSKNQVELTLREKQENRYNSARNNLLLIVALTVINIIMVITQSDTYFVFSAFVPYAIATIGSVLCGRYSAVYYPEDFTQEMYLPESVFVGFVAIAFIITALYLLCWIFSKKNRVGWLIFALVMMSLDTVLFVVSGMVGAESVVDIVFHIWMIVILALGVSAHYKLKTLPEDEVEGEQTEPEQVITNGSSSVLRMADTECKSRVLVQDTVLGHEVVYRRVKRTNELVVDGKVYDEYVALAETPHTLKAEINGDTIEAGYDGMFSFIKANGEKVKKKLRIY